LKWVMEGHEVGFGFFALFSIFFHSWRHTGNQIWLVCWLCPEVGDFAFARHLGDTFGFNWELICDGSWRLSCVLSRLLLESNPCCIQMIQLCYMVPSFLTILFWFNSHQVLFCKEPFKRPLSFGSNWNIGGFLVCFFFPFKKLEPMILRWFENSINPELRVINMESW
jgi:hypothetical protein